MNLHKYKCDYSLLLSLPFFGVFVLIFFVRINTLKYYYAQFFGVFCALMLLLIAIMSIPLFIQKKNAKRRKKRINTSTNIPLLVSWFSMCILMLYSDIVVLKKYFFISLILLVFFSSVFIMLKYYDNEQKDKFLFVFIRSVEISFIVASIICFLFRPYTTGARYSGLSINPNVYAKYLVTVWACLIAELDHSITIRKPLYKCIPLGAILGMAVYFLYMTGARTSFLAIAALSILWFVIRLVICRRIHIAIMRYLTTVLMVMIVSFFISYGLLATIPHIINHPLQFERDEMFTAVDYNANYVCAATTDVSNNGALNDVANDVNTAIENADKEPSLFTRIGLAFKEGSDLDTILNGRFSIYKSFSKNLNYNGHKLYSRKVNGSNLVAHNNVLQIGYTYGKLSMIPYVLLNIFSIILAIKFYIKNHNKRRNAAFPMLLISGFLITSLTECVIIPMQSLLAFSYFLCIGYLMYTCKDHTTNKSS